MLRANLVALASAGFSACCLAPVGQPDAGDGGADAGFGPADCLAAGGHCVIGPPANCAGMILASYDCNPPPRNPAGAVCCLIPPDAGPPTQCTIDAGEYPADSANPQNSCQSCQLAVSLITWTNDEDGSPCPDGGICAAGACVAGCFIDGGIVLSGDTDPAGCLVCLSATSSTSWTRMPNGTLCGGSGTSEICYAGNCQVGCFIAGTLYEPDDVNSQNDCQSCQPPMSTDQWSTLPKGTACGSGGICDSQAHCGPACTIGSALIPDRASNPADPSLCCNSSIQSAGQWSPRFVLASSSAVPAFPSEMAAGDFNGDGWPDLAVTQADPSSPGVAIFLNTGGALNPLGTYPVTGPPATITAADLNGDGFADLATNCDSIGGDGGMTLSVLIAAGDGTFGASVDYSSGFSGNLRSGKFNGEPTPSLVLGGDPMLLFRGIGDGGLFPGFGFDESHGGSVALADFNGDGLLDVAVAEFVARDVQIWLGTGDGGLTLAGSYPSAAPAPFIPFDLAAGDLNGDGIPDLAVAMLGSGIGGSVGVLIGKGDGSFGQWTPYAAPGYVWNVAVADLAGDGQGEVLFTVGPVGPAGNRTVLYQLTLGGAGFMAPLLEVDGGFGVGVGGPLVGDFNRDSAPDLAIFTSPQPDNSSTVQLYLNGCP